MGWSGGYYVMNGLIRTLNFVGVGTLSGEIYEKMLRVLEDQDWDTQEDCVGDDPVYDSVLRKVYPEWYEDEE